MIESWVRFDMEKIMPLIVLSEHDTIGDKLRQIPLQMIF